MSVRPNLVDIHSSAARTGRALLPASLFRTHELPHTDQAHVDGLDDAELAPSR